MWDDFRTVIMKGQIAHYQLSISPTCPSSIQKIKYGVQLNY